MGRWVGDVVLIKQSLTQSTIETCTLHVDARRRSGVLRAWKMIVCTTIILQLTTRVVKRAFFSTRQNGVNPPSSSETSVLLDLRWDEELNLPPTPALFFHPFLSKNFTDSFTEIVASLECKPYLTCLRTLEGLLDVGGGEEGGERRGPTCDTVLGNSGKEMFAAIGVEPPR